MAQEPAYQRCVTATGIKLEILDVEVVILLYVFVWCVPPMLPGSIPLYAGSHVPLSTDPCVLHPLLTVGSYSCSLLLSILQQFHTYNFATHLPNTNMPLEHDMTMPARA